MSWFLFPLAITIAAFALAIFTWDDDGYMSRCLLVFSLLVAAVISLAAWLVWAVLA